MVVCPFCSSEKYKASIYPNIGFNNKVFSYIQCTSCHLKYLNQMPSVDDYQKMYPPQYQDSKVATEVLNDPYKKMPGLRFSYGYQFDLIKKHVGDKASILDYGCGDGHFMINALNAGFLCDGAEFNPEYVKLLNQGFPKSQCVTIEAILNNQVTEKYDVIRLSNVLEHLTNPHEILEKLTHLLKQKGIFIIEGPIEDNFSVAETIRKVYFFIQKTLSPNKIIQAPPYHIFFSTALNQRAFFQKTNLSQLLFKVDENAWPFPPSIKNARGVKEKMMALVAQLSIFLKRILGENWGNTFIYLGQKN